MMKHLYRKLYVQPFVSIWFSGSQETICIPFKLPLCSQENSIRSTKFNETSPLAAVEFTFSSSRHGSTGTPSIPLKILSSSCPQAHRKCYFWRRHLTQDQIGYSPICPRLPNFLHLVAHRSQAKYEHERLQEAHSLRQTKKLQQNIHTARFRDWNPRSAWGIHSRCEPQCDVQCLSMFQYKHISNESLQLLVQALLQLPQNYDIHYMTLLLLITNRK